MGTGRLTLTRSLTLTLPEQGEVGGPKVRAESAGTPGGRQHWCGGRWETPPPGAGQRARCQSARPTWAPAPHTLEA